MTERTFVLVKPDAVQRGLVGEILNRLERQGLKLIGLRMLRVSRGLAEQYYAEHKGKPFYEELLGYVTSGPAVAAVLEGPEAVPRVRETMGATNPAKAEPGTIRADLGLSLLHNAIHGSDSPTSAAREIGLFFRPEDLLS